jgi:integrase
MRRFETKYIKYITDEEFKQILGYAEIQGNKAIKTIILILGVLGLRIGDAVKLKRNDFNEELTELHYIEEKTDKPRTVYIPNFLKTELILFLEIYPCEENDFLFKPCGRSNNYHIQKSTIQYFFFKFREIAGHNKEYYNRSDGKPLHRITPHTLKHYAIYKFLKACNDYSATQIFSNHSKIDLVVHYSKTMEGIEQQANILEKAHAF